MPVLNGLGYLWQNRERPKNLSRWVKVWVKRLFHLYGVYCLLVRSSLLRMRGASLGNLTVLGNSRIAGRLTNLSIGNETSLGQCEIVLHDRVTIGSRVVINDGVLLLTASHFLSDPQWKQKKAPIVIGDYAWIATNAILLPGTNVGIGAVVGAGAVVRGDVPDYAVVIGNPAVQLPRQRSAELNYCPVMLNAPFEAWVGPGFNNRQCIKSA